MMAMCRRAATIAVSLRDFQRLFASVPRICGSVIAKSGDFSREFDEGGGLKDRHMRKRKSWISQVLISLTLSVCGEVAERLKAAVLLNRSEPCRSSSDRA
jgi:hypothetical protein